MRQIRACLFACAIAAHLAGAAQAAAEFPAADDRWIRIDTTNFTIFSNTTQGATLRIARDLEEFRTVLRLFHRKLPERAAVPSFVYVFKSDRSYTPYKPLHEGTPRDLAGVFYPHREGNYISMTVASGIGATRLIYHEYMHQVFADLLPRVPVWFNEGMAEAYSTFEADEDSAAIGKTVGDHIHTLRGMPMMPLQELLDVTHESPVYNEGERRGIFYAESWALVHYLLWGSPERKPQLGNYLDRLARGEDPAIAFTAAFGADPEQLEGELRRYIEEGRYYYSRVEFDRQNFAGREETRQMGKDDVLFHLGDLLAHMDVASVEKAESYFKAALAVNAEHARAHAGLGYFETGHSRYDSAMQHYERAIALDPDDAMICFLAASTLMLRGRPGQPDPVKPDAIGPSDLERAQELFRNAILHNPSFAEAYVGYGQAIVYGGGDVKPAIKLLEAGWHLLPARSDLVVNLAVLHARNGDRERARYLVQETLPAMGDPWALQAVRDLLPDLDEPAPISGAAPSVPLTAGAARGAPPGPESDPPPLDPDTQRILQEIAEQQGDRVDSDTYNRQVDVYNRAVELANGGVLPSAIALLEELLPQLRAADLQARTRALLEQMKRDLARQQGQ